MKAWHVWALVGVGAWVVGGVLIGRATDGGRLWEAWMLAPYWLPVAILAPLAVLAWIAKKLGI